MPMLPRIRTFSTSHMTSHCLLWKRTMTAVGVAGSTASCVIPVWGYDDLMYDDAVSAR